MSFSIPSLKPFIKPITIASAASASTLLLHFDGTNGQTTTSDSSANAVAITMNSYAGTVALSSAQTKFGSTVFATTGSNIGYTTFPNSSLFNFGSNNWTIDFWWRPVTMPTATASINYTHFHTNFSGASSPIPGIMLRRNSRLDGGEFLVALSTDGSTQTTYTTSYGSWSTGTWYHIAIERHGSNINFYIDGAKISMSTTFSGNIYYNAANVICFGGGFLTTFAQASYTESYYDEFRIVNGTALYGSASFTRPTSPYTS
jgi:hypothetical protein